MRREPWGLSAERTHSGAPCFAGWAAGAGGAPAPAVDGNFRAASISWQAVEGNTVEIHLQTEWKRSYTGTH